MFCGVNMPNFESPIGNKRFAGQQLRELDVPDESGPPIVPSGGRLGGYAPPDIDAAISYQEQLDSRSDEDRHMLEVERQMRAARDAKRTGKVRLNDGAKRRIEMLLGMTRTTREVDIAGNVFGFQSLRAEEMRQAIIAAAEFDGTVQSPFEIRRQLIARSLTRVAGLDIHQFIGSNELDAKLQFVDELDEALLNRLYDEYLALAKESKDKFAIKSDADAQEVVEDLKK